MVSKLKLGIIQMSAGSESALNVEKAERMIREAAAKGADVVCLPELFSSPYFPQREGEHVQSEPIPGPTSRAVSRAAASAKTTVVGGTLYERAGRRRYNTALVFDKRGKVIGKYRKVHVPYDSHYFEKSYFDSGDSYTVVRTSFGKIAPLICFDQWYPEPARICRLRGAQILFYPTAIGWVRGVEPVEGNWQESWEAVQRGHAIANSVVVCAVNRVGVEGDMTFWGGSFVYDQFGKLLFRAGDGEGVFVVDVDLSLGKDVEDGWGFLRNRKPGTYRPLVK